MIYAQLKQLGSNFNIHTTIEQSLDEITNEIKEYENEKIKLNKNLNKIENKLNKEAKELYNLKFWKIKAKKDIKQKINNFLHERDIKINIFKFKYHYRDYDYHGQLKKIHDIKKLEKYKYTKHKALCALSKLGFTPLSDTLFYLDK